MLVDLPYDIRGHILSLYKAGLRERYEESPHYLIDVVRAACEEKADVVLKCMTQMVQQPESRCSGGLC